MPRVFPSTLPGASLPDLAITFADGVLRSDLPGARQQRRVSTEARDAFEVEWEFTDAQMGTFRTWFGEAGSAADGAAWFTMSLDRGYGVETRECRFDGPWSTEPRQGLRWRVTARIETRAA